MPGTNRPAVLLALCFVSSGCSGGTGESGGGGLDAGDASECSLETLVGEAAPVGAMDCGTLTLSGDDTDFEAARSCVSNAIDSETSFRVIWDLQGIDSIPRAAYLGAFDGGTLLVTRYGFDSDPSGGSDVGAVTSVFECSQFVKTDPCTNLRFDLCFDCPTGNEPMLRCDEGE
ncbi:MAG: hypothetical protein GY811_20190 [Myxococcales bacterium]|nr:hypothetical protein [Myxococcales bacterium]